MSGKSYLFVYGSLRPDAGMTAYQTYLADCPLVGRATIPGNLYDLGWYPGVKPLAADEVNWEDGFSIETAPKVTGYVFEVTESDFRRMDIYEGAPHLFYRDQTTATLEDGTELSTFVYYYNHSINPEERIPSGDFLRKGEDDSQAATASA
jgi:gamma-glutamylcyclotransferase (GGCT)/AIG2-like uncharacterized protein YtfP